MKNRSRLATVRLTFIFLILVVSVRCSRGVREMSVDEREIRSVRSASNDAIQKHDTALLARSWAVDYHIISSRNFELSGRNANRESFSEEFNKKPDVVYIRTLETIDIYAAWKMAGENGTWVGRWTEGGNLIELKGTYFAKWHKVEGQWLIRAEVFVPLLCSGGSYCNTAPI